MNTDEILNNRHKSYGSFKELAQTAQAIKDLLRNHKGWKNLKPDQVESLEMQALKIARILNGDPDHIDSWDDIAGYAKLVADRLRGVVR